MSNPKRILCAITIILGFAIISPNPSPGEVYRWVDRKGGIHYTDNPQNIPDHFQDKAEKRNLPAISTIPSDELPPVESRTGEYRDGEETEGKGYTDKNVVLSRLTLAIQSLKNQIKAKKELIQYVDNKRSLANNPYRNRVVSDGDLKLYEKYKKELPGDEKNLEELKSLKIKSGGE